MTDSNDNFRVDSSRADDRHDDDRDAGRKKNKRGGRWPSQLPWYIEIPVVVFTTILIIGLLHTFVGRLYVIPSESMEPTLHGCSGCTGDRIYVEKISYRSAAQSRGTWWCLRAPSRGMLTTIHAAPPTL